MSIRFKLSRRMMREIVHQYEEYKKLCVICEIEWGEEKLMLIKLWGNMYIEPGRGWGFICDCIEGIGLCNCEYSPQFTQLYRRMATEGIRLI